MTKFYCHQLISRIMSFSYHIYLFLLFLLTKIKRYSFIQIDGVHLIQTFFIFIYSSFFLLTKIKRYSFFQIDGVHQIQTLLKT